MFVLDEAYREFASPDIPDGLAALRRSGKPHIVLRTFSKAFGLAGLRVGYAVEHGVIVKPWLDMRYQAYVRASIGNTEENELFLETLDTILELARYEVV